MSARWPHDVSTSLRKVNSSHIPQTVAHRTFLQNDDYSDDTTADVTASSQRQVLHHLSLTHINAGKHNKALSFYKYARFD